MGEFLTILAALLVTYGCMIITIELRQHRKHNNLHEAFEKAAKERVV